MHAHLVVHCIAGAYTFLMHGSVYVNNEISFDMWALNFKRNTHTQAHKYREIERINDKTTHSKRT